MLRLGLPPLHRLSSPFPNRLRHSVNLLRRSKSTTAAPSLYSTPSSLSTTPASEWTGLSPEQTPGFTGEHLTSLPSPNLRHRGTDLRTSLEHYFENGWSLTELLFSSLRDESVFYRPPDHGLRHPMVFYYGHPAALAVNKLRVAGAIGPPVDPAYELLFEQGVDEMSWDDLGTPKGDWPGVESVRDYRASCREEVLDVIRNHEALDRPLMLGDGEKERTDGNGTVWALAMTCEHERIHLETSAMLIRELPIETLVRPEYWPDDHPSALPDDGSYDSSYDCHSNPLLPVSAGVIELGKPRTHATYSWDNEYGTRRIAVRPFEAQRTHTTNGQFLEFVQDGGYARPDLWTTEGWAWRTFRNTKWPHFWVPRGPAGLHEYGLRLMFEETEVLPLDLPVEVNFHEAKAYAVWRSRRDGVEYRLPSEAEYHRLREVASDGPSLQDARADEMMDTSYVEGGDGFRQRNINMNLAYGSPSAVDIANSPLNAFVGPAGNCWEYCEDTFAALPGYETNPLYDDFSTPCFDGKHSLIMGGSFISTGNEASVFSRFHFRPHFHNFVGFRLVSGPSNPELSSHDAPKPWADGWVPPKYAASSEGAHKYETDDQLSAYFDLHYGSKGATSGPLSDCSEDLDVGAVLDFPVRCARKLLDAASGGENATTTAGLRALDVGCAVGGASFELGRSSSVSEVVGVDVSRRFVDVATRLGQGETVHYVRSRDGGDDPTTVVDEVSTTAAVAPDVGNGTNIRFQVADACDLPESLGGFDMVLGANLLCRLPDPKAFVNRLGSGLVNPGGHVYLVSPFSWMEEYTRGDRWMSRADLRTVMESNGFVLVEEGPEPLLIRDHARKYQLIVPHGMLFRKNC